MLKVAGKTVQGLLIREPGGEGHPNMLILLCEKGYIMCGYLNKEAADKFEQNMPNKNRYIRISDLKVSILIK